MGVISLVKDSVNNPSKLDSYMNRTFRYVKFSPDLSVDKIVGCYLCYCCSGYSVIDGSNG